MLDMFVIRYTSISPNFILIVLRIQKKLCKSVTTTMKQCLWWRHRFWNLWILQKYKNLDISRTKHYFFFKWKNSLITYLGLLYNKNTFVARPLIKNNQLKTEIPTSNYKTGGKTTLDFLVAFHHIFQLSLYSHHQQWFKQMSILKIVLVIWPSPSWFVKCMAVNVW